MNIDPASGARKITFHMENLKKVVLTFDDAQINDANNINFIVWTFRILISNTYSSKNKYHVGTASAQLPIRSNLAAVRELNKNSIKILETILDLFINGKSETDSPIKLATKFGGDNQRKESDCTIRIVNTPELRDILKNRGLISEET